MLHVQRYSKTLKPIYIRPSTTKEVESCSCKKHFDARWSIKSPVHLCKMKEIDAHPFDDYYSFSEYITKNCS